MASARLRAILDPWLQILAEGSDPDAWSAGEVNARRIAADASFGDSLLAAEQERLYEAALDLQYSDVPINRYDLINRIDAYDVLWQALEDAEALRVEARRAPSAAARALRQRLDVWIAESGKTHLDDRTLDDATAALTDELVASNATDEDLALELELERLRVGRLHAGPGRIYLAREALVAMLAATTALEQAISVRASQAAAGTAGQDDRNRIPEDTLISLDRSSCYGSCPSYRVSIDANGRTRFLGRDHVARREEVEGRISADAVRLLLREFETIGFFALEDGYFSAEICDEWLTCQSTATIEFRRDGRSKTVIHPYGCRGFDKEQALMRLERVIDDVSRASHWVGKPEDRTSTIQILREAEKKARSKEGGSF